jgi:replicative DNA helicase
METTSVPHSREAEEAVIGAVLINPEVYFDVAQILTAEDFYIHRLRFIWNAYTRLSERRVPIDNLTVAEELDDMGRLEEIGGPAFLTALLNQVPTTLHAEAYANIVYSTRVRRKMLVAANEIAQLAYDESLSIEKASAESITIVTDAVEKTIAGSYSTAHDVFSRVYDKADFLSRQPAEFLPGVPTGFVDLNRLLGGGYQKGKLYTVAGRPGQGKSTLLLNSLYEAAYNVRKRCALFSLEMSNEENAERLISIDRKLDGQLLQTGKLAGEWESFVEGIETGSLIPAIFDDTPAITPIQLKARCRRIRAQMGLDVIFVDYLGLMSTERSYENRVQEVSYLSRTMKAIARELNLPIVMAHQLNREVEKRASPEPVLSDLADSGSLEQDSDVVMFIYSDKEMANVSHLKVAKHRGGPVGTLDLIFRRNITKFENAVTMSIKP